jgi:hypothetical protein
VQHKKMVMSEAMKVFNNELQIVENAWSHKLVIGLEANAGNSTKYKINNFSSKA